MIDYFVTVTTDEAQVILPVATWFERSSLVTRPDGFVQLQKPVVEPIGKAWIDWKFILELEKKFGLGDQVWSGYLDTCIMAGETPMPLH